MADLPIPEPPGFSDLTKAEQIRYLQALWDRIADQPGEQRRRATSSSPRNGSRPTGAIRAELDRRMTSSIDSRRNRRDDLSARRGTGGRSGCRGSLRLVSE